MTRYEEIKKEILQNPRIWLVTGVGGFIGSNLLETLLKLNQKVIGLDNFATGNEHNLDEVKNSVSLNQWDRFSFIRGDIRNSDDCIAVVKGVDYVLHQAALGSVPRSIKDPITSNSANISGFLNILDAAKEEGVKSFTYAASSSTYGDHPALPKVEENIGNPLSPYAVTKYVNELYAQVYARTYGVKCSGLRYFNVFGKRQDPNGAYAAVIPRWVSAKISGDTIFINGDGETSRDFCYVENVVQANILAATDESMEGHEVFNVAVGDRSTLKNLNSLITNTLAKKGFINNKPAEYRDFRDGDVRHSQASIDKARDVLGYRPKFSLEQGLHDCIDWYIASVKKTISKR